MKLLDRSTVITSSTDLLQANYQGWIGKPKTKSTGSLILPPITLLSEFFTSTLFARFALVIFFCPCWERVRRLIKFVQCNPKKTEMTTVFCITFTCVHFVSYLTVLGLHCTLAGLLNNCYFAVDLSGSSNMLSVFLFSACVFLKDKMQFSSAGHHLIH